MTTKAPPVTQEVEGVSNLDEDEEELDDKDIDYDEGLKDGFAAGDKVKSEDDCSFGEDLAQSARAASRGVAAGSAVAAAKPRRSTDDVAVRARVALAWEPRGHPRPNFVRPDQPHGIPARALPALRDDEPY